MNLDGTAHELTFGWGATASRFHWREQVPAGWELLGKFAEDLLNLLRSHGAQVDAAALADEGADRG